MAEPLAPVVAAEPQAEPLAPVVAAEPQPDPTEMIVATGQHPGPTATIGAAQVAPEPPAVIVAEEPRAEPPAAAAHENAADELDGPPQSAGESSEKGPSDPAAAAETPERGRVRGGDGGAHRGARPLGLPPTTGHSHEARHS